MKKQLFYRAAAATVLGLSLTTGVVAADSGSGAHTTGPHSRNRIDHRVRNDVRVTNDNDIDINNVNRQTSYSGDAKVSGSTHGGDARTGNVYNENSTDVEVSVDNSPSAELIGDIDFGGQGGGNWGSGGMSHTGPHSDNTVRTDIRNTVTIENDNNIDIRNTNTQTGRSGDARVSGNTHGGDAESGDVENVNSSSFEINVTN